MTGVMGMDVGIHGFMWQVVTGFTLGFLEKNINSSQGTNGVAKRVFALSDEAISA
jgi:hypothetical protein